MTVASYPHTGLKKGGGERQEREKDGKFTKLSECQLLKVTPKWLYCTSHDQFTIEQHGDN